MFIKKAEKEAILASLKPYKGNIQTIVNELNMLKMNSKNLDTAISILAARIEQISARLAIVEGEQTIH